MLVMLLLELIFGKPKVEEPEASGLGDFGFPTNTESRYIPVVWGSTRIDSPNVIWYGDFSTWALTTGGNVVGYRYYIGIDMALCWGELDSITAIQLDDEFFLKAGERRAYSNGFVPQVGFPKTSSGHRRIHVKDWQLTGGNKKGGGIDSDISFYYGTKDQPKSDYLSGVMNEAGETTTLPDGSAVPSSELLPNYAGVSRMVWEGGYLTERATAPQFKLHVQRFPTSLTTSYSKIKDDGTTADANPVHVIYEILTNTDWGLGINLLLIDTESFIAAAKKCFDEGNGYSYTLEDPKKAIDVIRNINDQVAGILFQNVDGKFEYSLNRKTYNSFNGALHDYDGNPTGIYTTDNIVTDGVTSDLWYTRSGEYVGSYISGLTTDQRDSLTEGDQIYIENMTSNVIHPYRVNGEYGSATTVGIDFMGEGQDPITQDLAPNYRITNGPLTIYRGFAEVTSISPSDIIKVVEANRQAWDQTFNTIHVKYLDRGEEFKETVAKAVDSGNLAIRKGTRTIKTLDLQGVRHPDTAALVAQRALTAFSFPMTSLTLDLSRKFSFLRPGSVVKVNHPDFGLHDFYMRLIQVGLPQDTSGNVSVKGVRDMFDEPTSSVQVGGSESLNVTIPSKPSPITNKELTGLTAFHHAKLGLPTNEVTTWHALGAPNAATSASQAF